MPSVEEEESMDIGVGVLQRGVLLICAVSRIGSDETMCEGWSSIGMNE